MKMFRKDEGFTLVELMVVVLIIGILVAIAIPIFNVAKASAQQKTCFANMRTVAGAWQTYIAQNPNDATATGWSNVTGVLVPNYIKTVPVCPAAGTYTGALTAQALAVSCSYSTGTAPHDGSTF